MALSRTGAELWFSRGFAFAGEIDLDLQPQMLDNGSVAGRVRALAGFRLVFGFGVGAFFLRHAIGADYITDALPRVGRISGAVGLAVEPGLGLQFKFARRGVAGFVMDFPTTFSGGTFAIAHKNNRQAAGKRSAAAVGSGFTGIVSRIAEPPPAPEHHPEDSERLQRIEGRLHQITGRLAERVQSRGGRQLVHRALRPFYR